MSDGVIARPKIQAFGQATKFLLCWLLRLWTLGVVVLMVVLLVQQISSFPRTARHYSGVATYQANQEGFECNDAKVPVLFLAFSRVEPTSRNALVSPDLCVSFRIAKHLKLSRSRPQGIFDPATLGVETPPRFRDRRLYIDLRGYANRVFETRLRDLGHDTVYRSLNVRLPTARVPLYSGGSTYPLDEFGTGIGAVVKWPPGVRNTFTPKGLGRLDGAEVVAAAEPGLGQWDVASGLDIGTRFTDVRFRRPLGTVLFVFGLLSTFVVLTIALAVARFGTRDRRRPLDILIGCAAIAVALLPLRSVLVPSDIGGLTMLDLILAALLASLAALGVWAIPVPRLRENETRRPTCDPSS